MHQRLCALPGSFPPADLGMIHLMISHARLEAGWENGPMEYLGGFDFLRRLWGRGAAISMCSVAA